VKVIFIEDVINVAKAGQTKEVANGYARNFLFPRKLAVLANSQAAAAVDAHLKKVVKQRAIEEAQMAELAKIINGTELVFQAKVGENDKLYGSITGADIAEMLSKQISREVDKKRVELVEPIRQVGVYDVTIRFTHEITAIVKATVMSDAPDAIKPERVEKKAEEKKAEKKEKPPKKEKKEKPPKEAKEEVAPAAEEKPAAEVKAEKPAKEKKAKAEKAVKEEKAIKEEKPAKVEKPARQEKPAKEEKPEKETKPAKEEKKEKKSKSKAKKTEGDVEEKKEELEGERRQAPA
jgi:large subunit ribosomal protein L9